MAETYTVETSHQFKVRRCGPARTPCVYEIHAAGAIRYVGSTGNLPDRMAAHWRRNTHGLREFAEWVVAVVHTSTRLEAAELEEVLLCELDAGPHRRTLRNQALHSGHSGARMKNSPPETKDPTPSAPASQEPNLYGGGSLLVLEEGEEVPDGWTVIDSTMLGGRRVARRVDR